MNTGNQLQLLAVFLLVAGCAAGPEPAPLEGDFRQRAVTKEEQGLKVTASVLTETESEETFDLPLYKERIQPIWFEITNNSSVGAWLLPVGIDPEYYTALEVSELFHKRSDEFNADLDVRMHDAAMKQYIRSGQSSSGYIFTNLDEGTKNFNADFITGDGELLSFTYFIPVPGIVTDHSLVDFDALYSEEEIIDVDEAGLRAAIREMPCCTSNKDGTKSGDPLNLVLIGMPTAGFRAALRAGWDETEVTNKRSTIKTIQSFLFGDRYRYSPVSSLYVFGRPQDIAIQKARGSINERNHARFWLTPYRFEGERVFIGQISRDIGVRFTWSTITTHKIDPNVDETRQYLLQDLWYSQGVRKYGYEQGVGASTPEAPGRNLTGDPFFTDGLRAVVWVAGDPVEMDEVKFVPWNRPMRRSASIEQ